MKKADCCLIKVLSKLKPLLLGVILGSSGLHLYQDNVKGHNQGAYSVYQLKKFDQREGPNGLATITVFKRGKSGHLLEFICEFPPSTNLSPAYLTRIYVEGVSRSLSFGDQAHYCNSI